MRSTKEAVEITTAQADSSGMVSPPRKGLAHDAYDRLLDLILNRELPPGAVLNERQISATLDISRTPAREALFRLENDGFVSRVHGHGIVVKEISIRDMIEILNIRRLLEVEAISLAVGRIQPEELDQIENEIHTLLATPNPSPAYDWEVDDHVHLLMARRSGNAHLVKMVLDLRMKTRVFNSERMPGRYRAGHEEHLQMIEALRQGDRTQACRLMAEHLDNVKQSIIQRLSTS